MKSEGIILNYLGYIQAGRWKEEEKGRWERKREEGGKREKRKEGKGREEGKERIIKD